MIVYRGLCSFTQKARLAQWLGSSLLVVVDSDTQGYVHNPPSRSTTEQKEEVNRLDLFFQQLRRGQLPDELGKRVVLCCCLVCTVIFVLRLHYGCTTVVTSRQPGSDVLFSSNVVACVVYSNNNPYSFHTIEPTTGIFLHGGRRHWFAHHNSVGVHFQKPWGKTH